MIRAHEEEADVFVSTVWNVPKAQAHQNDLNDDLWGIYRMLLRIITRYTVSSIEASYPMTYSSSSINLVTYRL